MMKRLLVISALMAATLPALAGPREDTLAGISRCSAIADDRVFLDCLYGAAQPLRARLGLPPAPVNQQQLVPRGYMPPAPMPRPASAMPSRPTPKVGVVSSFLGNDPSAAWIEVYSFDSHGLFTVTFSNGQVWRQNADDPARAHWTGRGSDHSIKFAVDSSGGNGELTVRGETVTYQVHKLR